MTNYTEINLTDNQLFNIYDISEWGRDILEHIRFRIDHQLSTGLDRIFVVGNEEDYPHLVRAPLTLSEFIDEVVQALAEYAFIHVARHPWHYEFRAAIGWGSALRPGNELTMNRSVGKRETRLRYNLKLWQDLNTFIRRVRACQEIH